MASQTQQYMPIAASCTQANAALSVRFLRDMADNVNNYCLYVGNHKLIGQPCIPEWVSHDSATDERVILPFAWRNVPDGFVDLLLVLRHYRREGTADITWRLYCSRRQYTGPIVMDTGYLSQDYSVAEIVSEDQYHRRSTATLDAVRGVVDLEPDVCWFVLTAENGDASSRGAITSIDLWPYSGTAETSE